MIDELEAYMKTMLRETDDRRMKLQQLENELADRREGIEDLDDILAELFEPSGP